MRRALLSCGAEQFGREIIRMIDSGQGANHSDIRAGQSKPLSPEFIDARVSKSAVQGTLDAEGFERGEVMDDFPIWSHLVQALVGIPAAADLVDVAQTNQVDVSSDRLFCAIHASSAMRISHVSGRPFFCARMRIA